MAAPFGPVHVTVSGLAFTCKIAASNFAMKPRDMTSIHRIAPEAVPDKKSRAT
jgi:hypothetical protein